MTRINLDQLRAARREARGDDRVELELGGELYQLPDELPVSVLNGFSRAGAGDLAGLEEGMAALFAAGRDSAGQPIDYAELANRVGFTLADLEALFSELMPAYGMDAGPFGPSADSSVSTTANLNPTSVGSTP